MLLRPSDIRRSGGKMRNETIVMGQLDREAGQVRAQIIPFAQRDDAAKQNIPL
jgi:hypothetical protein